MQDNPPTFTHLDDEVEDMYEGITKALKNTTEVIFWQVDDKSSF